MPNALPAARLADWQSPGLQPRAPALATRLGSCVTPGTGRGSNAAGGDTVRLFRINGLHCSLHSGEGCAYELPLSTQQKASEKQAKEWKVLN